MQEHHDYIIASAGAVGCGSARRLADAGHQVLLLKTGGSDKFWKTQMSASLRSVFKPTSKYAVGITPNYRNSSIIAKCNSPEAKCWMVSFRSVA